MSRMSFRNKQTFWYALYHETVEDYDDEYAQNGTHVSYDDPVMAYGNISAAHGNALIQQFGINEVYDKVIVLGDRDTPINEHAVLWIDSEPELDANGALRVDANGEIVTPWDYIVRRVGRGLSPFGSTAIAVSKVNVS